jgi:dipeptidyl aminopeptidase/acylaminoacyl peptidase
VKIFARWFPDSQHILVISESSGGQLQEHNSLGIYHWLCGSIRSLVGDPHRSIESAWVSPNGLVVVDEIQQATHSPSFIDPKTGLETRFPGEPGNLLPLGQAANGDWIAIYYASASPADLVRIASQAMQQDKLTPDQLTSLTCVWQRISLEPGRLHAAETFYWLSPDGLKIQGWLYRAQPNPERLIVFIHDGPSIHSEDKTNPEIQYFLARGFNVLDVNYRGSTGFGLKFRQSIKEGG